MDKMSSGMERTGPELNMSAAQHNQTEQVQVSQLLNSPTGIKLTILGAIALIVGSGSIFGLKDSSNNGSVSVQFDNRDYMVPAKPVQGRPNPPPPPPPPYGPYPNYPYPYPPDVHTHTHYDHDHSHAYPYNWNKDAVRPPVPSAPLAPGVAPPAVPAEAEVPKIRNRRFSPKFVLMRSTSTK